MTTMFDMFVKHGFALCPQNTLRLHTFSTAKTNQKFVGGAKLSLRRRGHGLVARVRGQPLLHPDADHRTRRRRDPMYGNRGPSPT